MNLRKTLRAYLSQYKNHGYTFVNQSLMGVQLNTVKNSLRLTPDQDDAWWFHLSKHHNDLYDIGCNVGYTAILALLVKPNRKIILIDPNPKALQIAAANLIANGLGNKAHFLGAFVGNTVDEYVKFYTIGAGAAGSVYRSHAKTAASINSFINVKTLTLDYLYDFYDVKPDLIKIDVEGAETTIMESAKKIAKAMKPTFFIEMHNVANLGMEAAGQIMLDWCDEMAYKAWYPKTGQHLEHAKTIKDRGKCHLLLLPEDKPYPEYLKNIEQNSDLPTTL
ncbi:MAG: FkbM family methyltransferase [Bacteroidota bacterium]